MHEIEIREAVDRLRSRSDEDIFYYQESFRAGKTTHERMEVNYQLLSHINRMIKACDSLIQHSTVVDLRNEYQRHVKMIMKDIGRELYPDEVYRVYFKEVWGAIQIL